MDRLYWKGRKIKKALLFKIKAFFHKNQKSFAGLIRWLGTLENLSERAVESGNVVYYVDYLYKIQKKLQNTIGKEKFLLEEEMALAEHIVVSYLGVIVGIRKYIEKWNEENCFCDVKLIERRSWKNPRWLGRKFDNYYVNEPYLLYIKMGEMKLKEAMLSKLLSKYNEKLAHVGKKYGFLGKICFDPKTSKYSDLYKDLIKGMKNCEEVSGEI